MNMIEADFPLHTLILLKFNHPSPLSKGAWVIVLAQLVSVFKFDNFLNLRNSIKGDFQ